MTDRKDQPPEFKDLRRRAEKEIKADYCEPEAMSQEECVRLIHELRVHQVELEMQNEELRGAQARLTESRDRFVDLYDFAPVGYLTLDEQGRVVEANLAAASMLELERQKLLGRIFTKYLAEEERWPFYQLLAGISQQQRQIRLKNGTGGVRVCLLDIHYDWNSEASKLIRITMTDITELQRTQEELRLHKDGLEELVVERTMELLEANERLRQANEELEALFEAAPLAIGVFDREGRFVKANAANERVFGWPFAEIKGLTIPFIPRHDSTQEEAILKRVLQGESVYGLELKQQRRDGTPIDIRLWAGPLRHPEGGLRGFVGLAEDISERKRAAEALLTQARVLGSMTEGVVVTNYRGQIIYTNAAFDQMFGYAPGELLDRYCGDLNAYPPAENQARLKEIIARVNSSGAWHGEFHNRKKDGRTFYTAAHLSALQVNHRKLYISVQEDITERRQAEEALRLSSQRLDLLAGTAGQLLASAAPREVMDNLCARVMDFLHCEVYLNFLAEGESGRLHLLAYGGITVEQAGRLEWIKSGQGVCGYTAQERRRIVAADIQNSREPRLQVLKDFGLQAYACHPLLVAGRVLGTLGFGSRTQSQFSEDDMALMLAVTDQVAVALERQQGEEALRQAHEELEQRVAARTEQLRCTVDKLLLEIVERERAETRLKESEARFAAFMKYLPGSAVMRDREGRFLFVNESWEKRVARLPGASLGKTVDDFWPPETAAKLKALDRQVLTQNKPLEAEVELPLAGEKRTFLSYRFPIRNEAGEAEMVGSIGIDITDRLKAEEARDRLIEILEATPDFVGTADREGRLFYLNRGAREMLGLRGEEDFTGMSYEDTMPAWAVEHILTAGRPFYVREGFWQGESAIRCREGREIPVSQVILAHRDPEGRIRFFSTICRDISDMKEAAEKLRRSEEKLRLLTTQLLSAQEDERKRLAAELHDELGHALLTLKLHLSGVEQKLLPEQGELKEKMARIVEYLTETVDEVRRLYYALSPGDLEDLGLTTALRNMVEEFQELYEDIDWQVDLADIDGLFPLPIQTMIYRIVQEALTNIGKHAYPKHVNVTVTREDQQAVFLIDDDGRGFSMDEVLEGDKRGMGLAAMAQRVSLAGGLFDVWSRENQGARVAFSIPFSQPGESV